MPPGLIDRRGFFLYNLIFSTSGQKLVHRSEGDYTKQ